MEKYTVAGYIDCEVIATGFLIPIYEHEEKLFFHVLSADNQSIVSFTPYAKEHYQHEQSFVPISNGSEKFPGASSFFVFKYRNKINFGSCDDKSFVQKMREYGDTLSSSLLRRKFKKIFI